MSLRSFHILFIITALGLCSFMTVWSGRRLMHIGGTQYGLLTVSSLLALILGLPYLYWFLSKGRDKEQDGDVA